MAGLARLLGRIAGYGRIVLVLGLAAGLALPELAAALRPWLPELVALLLFLTAYRVGPRQALGALSGLRRVLGFVVLLQVAAPLLALALYPVLAGFSLPLALGIVLMLSAPSVTGAPNFAIMVGRDPAPAMRVLVLGTALFPLTALPVMWALPMLGPEALSASARLIAVILGAVGAGFAARAILQPRLNDAARGALDGLAALALAVIVVGLMSAVGPLLRADPVRLLLCVGILCALNFGLQLLFLGIGRWRGWPEAVPVSIIAGNRNIALYLVALPEEVTGPLLLFIGCYQVPMYLTPLVLKRLHDRAEEPPG